MTTPRDNGEQLVRNGGLLAHIRHGNLDAGADRSRRSAEGHPVVAVEDAVEPRSIIEVRDAPPAAVTLDCRDLEADPLVGRQKGWSDEGGRDDRIADQYVARSSDDYPAMTQRAAERHGVLAVDEYGCGVGTGNGLAAAGGVSQARRGGH